jgi:hypothetical protein
VLPDGGIVQFKIWKLPSASKERPHGLKYSLFYGKDGVRIVGYDNEHGKGDHRHIREQETPYTFTTVDALVADFLADVEKERNQS